MKDIQKQNSLVAALEHPRQTHEISSKLCCATEKKLIRKYLSSYAFRVTISH